MAISINATQNTPKQLAQSRPGDTSAVSLYSPANEVVAVITHFYVADTGGSGGTFRLFHDEDGTTYDNTTALFYDYAVSSDSVFDSGEIELYVANPNGNLAWSVGSGNTLIITVYGVELHVG